MLLLLFIFVPLATSIAAAFYVGKTKKPALVEFFGVLWLMAITRRGWGGWWWS